MLEENIIIDDGVVKTREDAKRLADLYLGLAQQYRALAGLPPIITGSCQRKMVAKYNVQTGKN